MLAPASAGVPGPGETSTPSNPARSSTGGHGVVADHDRLGTQLVQVADDRVDERVVVVDHEDPRHHSPTVVSLKGMCGATAGKTHAKQTASDRERQRPRGSARARRSGRAGAATTIRTSSPPSRSSRVPIMRHRQLGRGPARDRRPVVEHAVHDVPLPRGEHRVARGQRHHALGGDRARLAGHGRDHVDVGRARRSASRSPGRRTRCLSVRRGSISGSPFCSSATRLNGLAYVVRWPATAKLPMSPGIAVPS